MKKTSPITQIIVVMIIIALAVILMMEIVSGYSYNNSDAYTSMQNSIKVNLNNVGYIALGIYVVFEIAMVIRNMVKLNKLENDMQSEKSKEDYDYCKTIPDEDASIMQVAARYFDSHSHVMGQGPFKIFLAILLEFTTKGYLTINKDSDVLSFKVEKLDIDLIDMRDKPFYEYFKRLSEDCQKEFTIEDIGKDTESNYFLVTLLKTIDENKKKEEENGMYIPKRPPIYGIFLPFIVCFAVGGSVCTSPKMETIALISALIKSTFFIKSCIFLIAVLLVKSRMWTKAVLLMKGMTKEGYEQKRKLKGFEKYLNSYSELNNEAFDSKKIERYLLHAIIFGNVNKVIEELDAAYPNEFCSQSEDVKKSNFLFLICEDEKAFDKMLEKIKERVPLNKVPTFDNATDTL